MSDNHTPCSEAPDQWYTERDGRRYDDEPLIAEVDLRAALEANAELEEPETPEAVLARLVEAATKARLVERRQARDACFTCPVRLMCLSVALENREQYGIWGGYFPEQRRAIEREMDRRESSLLE